MTFLQGDDMKILPVVFITMDEIKDKLADFCFRNIMDHPEQTRDEIRRGTLKNMLFDFPNLTDQELITMFRDWNLGYVVAEENSASMVIVNLSENKAEILFDIEKLEEGSRHKVWELVRHPHE